MELFELKWNFMKRHYTSWKFMYCHETSQEFMTYILLLIFFLHFLCSNNFYERPVRKSAFVMILCPESKSEPGRDGMGVLLLASGPYNALGSTFHLKLPGGILMSSCLPHCPLPDLPLETSFCNRKFHIPSLSPPMQMWIPMGSINSTARKSKIATTQHWTTAPLHKCTALLHHCTTVALH